MYSNARNAANAYANVGLETGVVAASPHQLILMLFDGAELAVRMAIRYIQDGDLQKKSDAITKASCIIASGLRASLDARQGGDIAGQLDALYDYMIKRLMLAHINNQIEPLEEVLGLLRELHGAWKQIGTQGHVQSTALHPLAA
jgi:flagellar protein FliS